MNSTLATSCKPSILVTGGTGFLGSYLIRELLRCETGAIRAVRRPQSRMEMTEGFENRVEWAEGNILDVPFLETALEGVKYVFHCAGMVSYDSRDVEQMYQVNKEGTANIVNIALETGVEKLIHTSSIAAIGRNERENQLDEKTKWQRSKLNTHYAVSKYLAEQEVWRGAAEGLKVAVASPGVILGSQLWNGGTGKMFERVWKGLKYYTPGVNGFVDVRDVARFMALLGPSDVENERFILSAENLPYKTVFEEIANALHKTPPQTGAGAFMRGAAWRADWVKSRINGTRSLITKETAMNSARQYFYSNEKSLRYFPQFNYRPVRETIGETGKQFLESKKESKEYAILGV